MDNLILLILGLFISVLGITNIKGNISTIHSYNRRKVKEEDIPKYGKVVGTGTLIMGVSFILWETPLSQRETACRETFNFAATSACVNPAAFRACVNFSSSSMRFSPA